MIAIVDYGMGNIHSVQKALQLFGAQTLVTNNPQDILACQKVVLPGVGAFADAMQELEKQNLIPALIKHIKNKKTFLGICLGMQLLLEASQESKGVRGLSIIKGKVVKFKEKNLKVPHMGWNQLDKVSQECPLLKDILKHPYVYFCHSYYPDPKEKNVIASTTNYGTDFPSVIWKENIYGVQFHPEKSQSIGLKIIENFVKLC